MISCSQSWHTEWLIGRLWSPSSIVIPHHEQATGLRPCNNFGAFSQNSRCLMWGLYHKDIMCSMTFFLFYQNVDSRVLFVVVEEGVKLYDIFVVGICVTL
jgi:hypothetical protein